MKGRKYNIVIVGVPGESNETQSCIHELVEQFAQICHPI